MLTIEEFLRLSNRLREYYGKQIKDRFSEYTFSPNEISILILLQNNTSITTSTHGSLTPLFTTDLKHSA